MNRESESSRARDAADLAGFGYRQRLDRTLGGFSSFAAGFSYLSILTGLPQLFYLGYGSGGPASFWTWPAVFAGQFTVALCFAEMAADCPVSGGVYRWGGRVGWMAGWVYLACSVISLASVATAMQGALPKIAPGLFQVVDDPAGNAVVLGCGLIAIGTMVNVAGVKWLARINNVGVFAELAGAVALIVLLTWGARRGFGVVFDTLGHGAGSPTGYLGPALLAALTPSFVMYGFDTAGALSEETDDPRRRAPRAILGALAAVGGIGALLILAALRAAPDLADPRLGRLDGGMPAIIRDVLGPTWGRLMLVDVALAVAVCALTVQASAVRLVFAMARDGVLPWSSRLAALPGTSKTPKLPALAIGVVAAAVLAANANFPQVVETMASVAIVWANLAYLLVTAPMLIGRWKRPARRSRAGLFSMGRWGLPVNAAAVAWGLGMVVNVGWPRPEVFGEPWPRRFAAPMATAVLLGAGAVYHGASRRRGAGVLEDHRAPALAAGAIQE